MRSLWAGSILAWILKVKPEKPGFFGPDLPGGNVCLTPGGGATLNKGVQHFPNPKIINGTAKKNRGLGPLEIIIHIKGICGSLDQVPHHPVIPAAWSPQFLIQNGIIQITYQQTISIPGGVPRGKKSQLFFYQDGTRPGTVFPCQWAR